MSGLHAGAPLLGGSPPVGRMSGLVVDADRADRMLPVECWYPIAADGATTPTIYELLPGTGFTSAGAFDAPPAPGRSPLVLFSHGRTGTRIAYTLLCEALAALGCVVISADHPGDTLIDFALEIAVDDATNERQRVEDARLLLDAALGGADGVPAEVRAAIDPDRIAVAGHSYGGYTALGLAAGAFGAPDERVRAVVGMQAYTRALTDADLARVGVPTLLSVATRDATTPPAVDADRPWALLATPDTVRVDVADAAHQACSDVGLYAELAPQVPDLPQNLRDYLEETAADTREAGMRSWREAVALQARIATGFLDEVLGIDPARGAGTLAALTADPAVTLQRRLA
ncbi:MAG: alpha/beta hydrolase family protein [Actinomycetes bacterium]